VTLPDRDLPPPPPPRSGHRWWILLLLLLAVAGGGFLLLTRPRLVFTNRLAAPVRLVLGQREPLVVAPGVTMSLAVSGGRALVAEWELIRPLSADSQPMGEAVRGSAVMRGPRGRMPVAATTRTGEADYFAPLITNASGGALRVTVNAGLQGGALDCGCAVRAGTRRVFIGYYRLYQNSTVQARAASGATATFRDLGPQVKAADGSLGLRFEDRDF